MPETLRPSRVCSLAIAHSLRSQVKYSFDNKTKGVGHTKTSTKFQVDFLKLVEFTPAANASGSDGYDYANSKVVKTMDLDSWQTIKVLATNPVGTNSFSVATTDNVVALGAIIGEDSAGLDPNYLKIDVNITGWVYAQAAGSYLALLADVRSDTKIKSKVKGSKTTVLKVDLEDSGDANLPFGRFSWVNSAAATNKTASEGFKELSVVATSEEHDHDGKVHKTRGVAFTFDNHGTPLDKIVWDPEIGSGYGEQAVVNVASALAPALSAVVAVAALCLSR